MKYPVILVIPVLMLLDYYLTLLGATLRERGYGKHMKVEQYEMNPLWQSSVNKRRWLNLRHLASVAAVTAVVIVITQGSTDAAAWPVEMFIGVLVVVFAAIVGRHLCNLLTFRYVIRNPDGLQGTVSFSHKTVLKFSQYQLLVTLCPFAAVLLLVPGAYTVGGLVGLAGFFLAHIIWRKKYDKRMSKNASEPKEQAEVEPNND